MNRHSLKDGRTLFADGTFEVEPDNILDYSGYIAEKKVFVTASTEEIEEFNDLNVLQITTKTELGSIDPSWNISEVQDLEDLLDLKLANELERGKFRGNDIDVRMQRVDYELAVMKHEGMLPILYAILHVINTFEKENVVWGVGRGSSTSSYILYLIGLHDIDSVRFDLDFSEFIH